MSCRSSAIVLVFACWFLIPRAAQARGVGTDYFLLSPDGKLLWQHRWDRADHVDPQAELVYRTRDGETTGEPLTRLPTAAGQALQIVRSDGILFHLSKDKAPTLTAFDNRHAESPLVHR
jgi:hypothetical protein